MPAPFFRGSVTPHKKQRGYLAGASIGNGGQFLYN